jgi:uracil DNA glycosylase
MHWSWKNCLVQKQPLDLACLLGMYGSHNDINVFHQSRKLFNIFSSTLFQFVRPIIYAQDEDENILCGEEVVSGGASQPLTRGG